jgi:hypothetical protein
MTDTLPTLALIFVLSFLAESLTEYFVRPVLAPGAQPGATAGPAPLSPLWLRYAAAVTGIGLALLYRVDLLALFGLEAFHPIAGWILTGILIGRGSNYLHDLVDGWLGPPALGKSMKR